MHRHIGDRVAGLFLDARRYHCGNPDCGWEGIISRPPARETAPTGGANTWASRLGWMAAGVAVTVSGFGALKLYRDETVVVPPQLAQFRVAPLRAPAAQPATIVESPATTEPEQAMAAAPQSAAVQPVAAIERPGLIDVPEDDLGPEEELHDLPKVAAGESFDGVPLADDDARLQENPTDLSIRRGCVWGAPGRTPYKGTVRQALVAARLPEEVVRKIDLMVERRMISDRVMITRDSIRSVSGKQRFHPNIVAMGFGKTLCFGTRVNFAPGHVEIADLYEATDAEGQKFSVMVPYVCRNVSVLAARAERAAPRVPGGVLGVPEPATLASLASAVVAMLVATRVRRRRDEKREAH